MISHPSLMETVTNLSIGGPFFCQNSYSVLISTLFKNPKSYTINENQITFGLLLN